MDSARLAVPVERREGGGTKDETLWLRVLAFGRPADVLARQGKGDPVSVVGTPRMKRWESREGEAREALGVVADAVMGSGRVRPGGGKGRVRAKTPASASIASGTAKLPFDDDIPF